MGIGLKSLIGINMSARRPRPLIRLARPPVRLPTVNPPAARLALESAVVLGAFVALTAFLSRLVVERIKRKPSSTRSTVEVASSADGFEQAMIAFESFQLSAT